VPGLTVILTQTGYYLWSTNIFVQHYQLDLVCTVTGKSKNMLFQIGSLMCRGGAYGEFA
jgi:hypothetical protein